MAQEEKKGLSPEEEILELQRKLDEKKKELAERGISVPDDKEILRGVLQRHIEEVKPSLSQAPVSAPAVTHQLTDDLNKKADDLQKKSERDEQVRALIELALTHTIQDAVNVASRATPYLLDELHDHLVDDYYDKLIALRKLKPM